jgi:UDP-2,4-diacetamido-2,4,6-trideoxy-beta-L-altropyranose hydrolase
MTRILFRADGNNEIGWGHVLRCVALSEHLINEFKCLFCIYNPSEFIKETIESAKASYKILNFPDKAINEFLELLNVDDIVVIDGYDFTDNDHKLIKSKGCKLICIDDYHNISYNVDAVINHAPFLTESSFLVSDRTKLYLGLEFALLRKPFYDLASKVRERKKIKNVFICFGGGKYSHIIEKIIVALSIITSINEIHVVNSSNINYKHSSASIILHQNLNGKEMAELMSGCELSICPASNISLESFFAKMFIITGITSDNQQTILDGLRKFENVKSIGNWENTSVVDIKNYFLSSILYWNDAKISDKTFRNKYTSEKLLNIFKYI